ncbi:MAG: hypothetical protein M0042_16550 [Nitrospiraceae bacterium]|nr:hypothetical protein [Nitrospiraceae bacterium]
MKNVGHLVYHIVVILLSAGIAVSLPVTLRYITRKVSALWAFAENEQIFMVIVEIAIAVLLVLLVNHIARAWKDRKFASMAESAGLNLVANARGFFSRKRVKELKERTGFGRDVMVIGSTGYRTFVDPAGDLHQALQNSRQARIMLLDPLKEGAISRAKSIPDPDVSPESFREQIIRSIDFLKGLKAAQKNVRLKLYQDMPLFKLAILGDYACLRHYHTGLHVDDLPEFVFKHDHDPGSLYNPLYQYFLSRWQDPSLPEYDLETDELVYRDRSGNETRRERFNDVTMEFGDAVVERELALTA